MHESTHKRLHAGALLTAALLFTFGGSAMAASSQATTTKVKLVNPGTLTACTHLPYKPFEFVDADGKIVGFDVDLTNLIAKRLGVKLDIISIGWNQITSGAVFAAGKCDVAFGGATITPKRKKAVLFSDPYFNAVQALLVKKDSGIKGLADLKGKRLAAETATTGQIYAKKHAKEFGYSIVIYDDTALETTAVSAGTVAAAIQDNAPLAAYAKAHPETEIATTFDTGEHYGLMAKINDANGKRLIDIFNQELAKIRKNGEYAQMYEHWLGTPPPKTSK